MEVLSTYITSEVANLDQLDLVLMQTPGITKVFGLLTHTTYEIKLSQIQRFEATTKIPRIDNERSVTSTFCMLLGATQSECGHDDNTLSVYFS